jgi:hypothetical protein
MSEKSRVYWNGVSGRFIWLCFGVVMGISVMGGPYENASGGQVAVYWTALALGLVSIYVNYVTSDKKKK